MTSGRGVVDVFDGGGGVLVEGVATGGGIRLGRGPSVGAMAGCLGSRVRGSFDEATSWPVGGLDRFGLDECPAWTKGRLRFVGRV